MHPLFILLEAGADAAPGGFGFQQMIFFVAILGIFYFFMIRPQQKRAKEEKLFRESLEKGDKVVTIGGIHGQVEQIDDTSVIVRVDNNTKLRVDKVALRAMSEAGTEVKK